LNGKRQRVAIFALASMVMAAAPGSPGAVAGADRPTRIPVFRYAGDPATDLATMQARTDEAVRVVEEAERLLQASVAEEQKVTQEIERLDAELTRLAVHEYMDVGMVHSEPIEITSDPQTGAERRALVDAVAGDRATLLDEQKAAKEKLLKVRPEVEQAVETAKVHRTEMETQLEALKQAQQRQAEADRLRAAQGQAASRRNVGSVQAGGGKVNVRGIVVDGSIATQLEAMLAKAEADGIILSGGGYRDPSAQRRLRAQNCPSANSPASACSPPTAKPGSSMHEQGLAIDFSHNGALIESRSSAGFRWLSANAGQFGFKNLPSEPWHWSVNGN
jgi:LAS superfamily LD-carboxypeptidase LdcB